MDKVVRIGVAVAATLALNSSPGSAQTPGRASAGGANQRVSLEGCVGESLFNGIWRLRVLDVKPFSSGKKTGPYYQPGWAVTLELKNGSATGESLTMSRTGIDVNLEGVDLITADGNTLNRTSFAPGSDGPLYDRQVTFKNVPQGGTLRVTLPYLYPTGTKDGAVQKAVKFLMRIDPAKVGSNLVNIRARYTTPNPSFRVNLTCKK